MVAVSISNEKIKNTTSYNLNQRGALPPFGSNSYLIAESLLGTKAHSLQNKNINVFNPEYGVLERPDKMISYLLDASYSKDNKAFISKVEFHNYNKNKNQEKPSNVNLYSFFMSSAVKAGLKKLSEEYTIVFTAHHDVVNTYTDNIQDNLASCSHLIALNRRICEYISGGGLLHHNIMIAILDEEESGMGGSKALAINLKNTNAYGSIACILNLELTARGTHFWIDQSYNAASMVFKEAVKNHTGSTYANINCPPNDAMPLRAAGYHAACIGTLTRKEMKKVLSKDEPTPYIWSICHSKDDKFIHANECDMNYFTSLLFKLSINEWSQEIDKGILNNKPYGSINYKNKKFTTGKKAEKTIPLPTSSYTHTGYNELTYDDRDISRLQRSAPVSNKLIKNGKFNYFTNAEIADELDYWSELFNDNLNTKASTSPITKEKDKPTIKASADTQANGFFKSNLESRICLLDLRSPEISKVEDFMSRGKFISELDFLMYKEINPSLADFYMENLKKITTNPSSMIYSHTFYDPNIKHTLDAIRSYCSNEEDFYYMGLLGIRPVSLSSKFKMTQAEYLAFITGHAIRVIDCDRDLKTCGHKSRIDESYVLSFDDIFVELIGAASVMSDPDLLDAKFASDDKFYCFTEDFVWPFVTTYISMLASEDDALIETDINFAKLTSFELNRTLFKDFSLSFFRDIFSYFDECNSIDNTQTKDHSTFTFNKKLFEAGFTDGQKGGQLLKHNICLPTYPPEKVLGFSLGRIYDQVISYDQSSQNLLEAITHSERDKCNSFFGEALGIWSASVEAYLDYCAINNPKNKEAYIYFASLCPAGLVERIKDRHLVERIKSGYNVKINSIPTMKSDIFTDKIPLDEMKQLNLPIDVSIDSSMDTSILPNFIEKTFTSLNSLASKIGKMI